MPVRSTLPLLLSALLLAGCNGFGGESAEAVAARREADGKAIGGACRHAGRAIEDCYTLNRKADKAAVYAGWREMNDYMRENKLEPVAPQLSGDTPVAHAADAAADAQRKSKAPSGEKAADRPRPKDTAASAPAHDAPAKKRDS